MTPKLNLESTFLRLRQDMSAEPLPVNAGFWEKLTSGGFGDFRNEYLVSSLEFDSDWPTWELHPNGDELVCLLEGEIHLVLDREGKKTEVDLRQPGDYVIVPRGTWHTAKVNRSCRMLFITPGEGTENRESPDHKGSG